MSRAAAETVATHGRRNGEHLPGAPLFPSLVDPVLTASSTGSDYLMDERRDGVIAVFEPATPGMPDRLLGESPALHRIVEPGHPFEINSRDFDLMLSGMAHEVKANMHPLLLTASLLSQRLPAKDRNQLAGSLVTGLAKVMNILDYFRDVKRNAEGETEPMQIGQTLSNWLDLNGPGLERRNIRVEVSVDSPLPSVLGNSVSFTDVLTTLTDNASHAMEDRQEEEMKNGSDSPMNLAIRVFTSDRFVFTEIEDNGKGISAENIERLGEPRFTTRERKGGHGLGLYMAGKILSAQNAALDVASTEGVGTTFRISYPIHSI